jgi:nitrous oxide reductase
MSAKWVVRFSGAVAVSTGLVAVSQCAPRSSQQGSRQNASDAAAAAQKVYVAPGDHDPYYLFASGGHSGNVYVYGVPSMRHISTIPVFTPYPATGYGFDDDSKKMLGDLTWATSTIRHSRRPTETTMGAGFHQRDERPGRADRSPRLQDEADHRTDP